MAGGHFKFGSPAETFHQLLIQGCFTKLSAQEKEIERGLARLEEQTYLLEVEQRLSQVSVERLLATRQPIKYLSDDSQEEEEEDQDSDCKSISSIRELLIEKSFSQDDDDEADRTESENENMRSVKSHEDTNNSQKEEFYPQIQP